MATRRWYILPGGKARFDSIDSGIDAIFDFQLLYPLRRVFAESKPIRELPQMLSHDSLYVKPEMLVTFLGNHDLKRFMNEPNADSSGLKLAFRFLMTTRRIPLSDDYVPLGAVERCWFYC